MTCDRNHRGHVTPPRSRVPTLPYSFTRVMDTPIPRMGGYPRVLTRPDRVGRMHRIINRSTPDRQPECPPHPRTADAHVVFGRRTSSTSHSCLGQDGDRPRSGSWRPCASFPGRQSRDRLGPVNARPQALANDNGLRGRQLNRCERRPSSVTRELCIDRVSDSANFTAVSQRQGSHRIRRSCRHSAHECSPTMNLGGRRRLYDS